MSHLESNNLRHDDGHEFQYRSNHRSKNASDERKSGGTIASRSALARADEHGRTNRSDHQSVAATATANSGESANKRYSNKLLLLLTLTRRHHLTESTTEAGYSISIRVRAARVLGSPIEARSLPSRSPDNLAISVADFRVRR